MAPETGSHSSRGTHFWRYTIIGLITVAPLWVTWLVFDFILNVLYRAGDPGVPALARLVRPLSEPLADWLLQPSFRFVLAVLITMVTLYTVGRIASHVVGRQVIAQFESLLQRIPLAQAVYGATKSLIAALRDKPAGLHRVVLINFPSGEMKTIGFVTRLMHDRETGSELAVVYVPTAPNPTSGYIEIVPVENLTETDWSMEEAMRFVMTGGTNGPQTVSFNPAGAEGAAQRPARNGGPSRTDSRG
jgi:uncharacterized membrane protein